MEKRKLNQDSSTHIISKKPRTDGVSNSNGKFSEDHVPEGVFPIGNDFFVIATTFQGNATVHIRQYKKHGKFYYPTKNGITLRPWWIEYIMGIKKVPDSKQELPHGLLPPENQIQITSENFNDFCFKRIEYGLDKKVFFKEISISRAQWDEMLKCYNDIAASVLDHVFRCMNLLDAFKNYHEGPIEKELPPSSDNSLGQAHLKTELKNSICNLLVGKGLKEPKMMAEELWANSDATFNSYVFSLEEMEIAESFYSNLWENQNFLLMKPIYYVTTDFFKNLRLDLAVREARNFMCPEDTFEFYDDEC
ncbi:uncharacterized protein [Parasteatoda tepidariorum]|uniref:uncharacterized protein n=1 Tax=Parasteatoda tepidariorum TaxID=114398 RepID=UPI001C728FD6|nr:uncharacterized protein LOC122272883 [Parasteatoda tepidariorum]